MKIGAEGLRQRCCGEECMFVYDEGTSSLAVRRLHGVQHLRTVAFWWRVVRLSEWVADSRC